MGTLEFDFGEIADSAYDEDGHLELGLDHYTREDGEGGSAKAAATHIYGFESRPLDPDKGEDGAPTAACAALWIRHGDHASAIPLDDPRAVAKLPKQRKGGSRQYCADGNYAMFDGEDPAKQKRAGSYTVSVKYAKGDATKAMLLSFNKRTAGEEEMTLIHGEGHSLSFGGSGKRPATLMNANGDAWFRTDDEGNTIAGKTTILGSCVFGDPSATGVATQLSMLPMFIAMQAMLTTMQAFFNFAGITAISGGTAVPVATAAAALQVSMALPTTFSLKVKASS